MSLPKPEGFQKILPVQDFAMPLPVCSTHCLGPGVQRWVWTPFRATHGKSGQSRLEGKCLWQELGALLGKVSFDNNRQTLIVEGSLGLPCLPSGRSDLQLQCWSTRQREQWLAETCWSTRQREALLLSWSECWQVLFVATNAFWLGCPKQIGRKAPLGKIWAQCLGKCLLATACASWRELGIDLQLQVWSTRQRAVLLLPWAEWWQGYKCPLAKVDWKVPLGKCLLASAFWQVGFGNSWQTLMHGGRRRLSKIKGSLGKALQKWLVNKAKRGKLHCLLCCTLHFYNFTFHVLLSLHCLLCCLSECSWVLNCPCWGGSRNSRFPPTFLSLLIIFIFVLGCFGSQTCPLPS